MRRARSRSGSRWHGEMGSVVAKRDWFMTIRMLRGLQLEHEHASVGQNANARGRLNPRAASRPRIRWAPSRATRSRRDRAPAQPRARGTAASGRRETRRIRRSSIEELLDETKRWLRGRAPGGLSGDHGTADGRCPLHHVKGHESAKAMPPRTVMGGPARPGGERRSPRACFRSDAAAPIGRGRSRRRGCPWSRAGRRPSHGFVRHFARSGRIRQAARALSRGPSPPVGRPARRG